MNAKNKKALLPVSIKMKWFKNLWIYAIVFVITACSNPPENSQVSEIKREMKEMAIVRATEPQIIEKANALGKETISFMEKSASSQIISRSLPSCIPVFDSLEQVVFKKASFKVEKILASKLNQTKNSNKKIQQILDAYAYNFENKLPISNNLQKVDAEMLMYTSPISIQTNACQKCHSGLKSNTVGDTIGIWKVLLPRKEVIINLAKK